MISSDNLTLRGLAFQVAESGIDETPVAHAAITALLKAFRTSGVKASHGRELFILEHMGYTHGSGINIDTIVRTLNRVWPLYGFANTGMSHNIYHAIRVSTTSGYFRNVQGSVIRTDKPWVPTARDKATLAKIEEEHKVFRQKFPHFCL